MSVKMTNAQYGAYVKSKAPPSPIALNMTRAFLSGGAICCVGQLILNALTSTGVPEETALIAESVIMVFLGALLTALHVYDKLAKYCGAGTLVPITGFANSVAAPAIDFKSEGVVTGTAAKMFIIAGPVIVFGVLASVIYGLLYNLLK